MEALPWYEEHFQSMSMHPFWIFQCLLFFTADSAKTAEQVKTTEVNQDGKLIS